MHVADAEQQPANLAMGLLVNEAKGPQGGAEILQGVVVIAQRQLTVAPQLLAGRLPGRVVDGVESLHRAAQFGDGPGVSLIPRQPPPAEEGGETEQPIVVQLLAGRLQNDGVIHLVQGQGDQGLADSQGELDPPGGDQLPQPLAVDGDQSAAVGAAVRNDPQCPALNPFPDQVTKKGGCVGMIARHSDDPGDLSGDPSGQVLTGFLTDQPQQVDPDWGPDRLGQLGYPDHEVAQRRCKQLLALAQYLAQLALVSQRQARRSQLRLPDRLAGLRITDDSQGPDLECLVDQLLEGSTAIFWLRPLPPNGETSQAGDQQEDSDCSHRLTPEAEGHGFPCSSAARLRAVLASSGRPARS